MSQPEPQEAQITTGDREEVEKVIAPAEDPQQKTERVPGWEKGKYEWSNEASNKNADNDMAGDAITKYSWSDGKKAVSVYVELDGLDDVAEDALIVDSDAHSVTLTIASVGPPGGKKKRCLVLRDLAKEISGVNLQRKLGKNTVVLKLQKKDVKTWPKLIDAEAAKAKAKANGDEEPDPEEVDDIRKQASRTLTQASMDGSLKKALASVRAERDDADVSAETTDEAAIEK